MSWQDTLNEEIVSDYFVDLQDRIRTLRNKGIKVHPPKQYVFSALELTPLNQVRVVILGQDPYHGDNQAHGLSFSVQRGNSIPPSLRIIFKELRDDLGCEIPVHGDLTSWAQSGVLLLNSILTVEHKRPGSHKKMGWEKFTDTVIQKVSDNRQRIVFFLWGKYARSKKHLIDEDKHLILEAPHPAAEVYQGGRAGFYGSKPFSKANAFLKEEIDWAII